MQICSIWMYKASNIFVMFKLLFGLLLSLSDLEEVINFLCFFSLHHFVSLINSLASCTSILTILIIKFIMYY